MPPILKRFSLVHLLDESIWTQKTLSSSVSDMSCDLCGLLSTATLISNTCLTFTSLTVTVMSQIIILNIQCMQEMLLNILIPHMSISITNVAFQTTFYAENMIFLRIFWGQILTCLLNLSMLPEVVAKDILICSYYYYFLTLWEFWWCSLTGNMFKSYIESSLVHVTISLFFQMHVLLIAFVPSYVTF